MPCVLCVAILFAHIRFLRRLGPVLARLAIVVRPFCFWVCRMFVQTQQLWLWHQAYQHHEQLPMAFGGRWPSWNSDLDNRPW
jgi:hypothetical protein